MAVSPFSNARVTTPKMPVNPTDKCTIVSIYPLEIIEDKVTLDPGHFVIPAGSYEKPSILVVGTSSWWLQPDPEKPPIEIPVSSLLIADSVVKDYCSGLLGYSLGHAQPGLFIIPGNLSVETIKKDHKSLLDRANLWQRNWYLQLVLMADTMWSQSNGNPRAIGENMKLAAQELNLKDKPWLQDFTTIQKTNCKACGNLVNPEFPVCPNCRAIINEVKAKELGLKFAAG